MDEHDAIGQLLGRVALRDAQAFETLYRQTAGRLLAVALRVVHDRAAAQDVVQEVFIAIWNQKAAAAPGQTMTLAWLGVVTRNRAIDWMRRRKPEQPLHWVDSDGQEHHHDAVDEAPSALERLHQQQEGGRLAHCLDTLEPDPRRATLLAFFEGLTHMEIADRMQRPLGTVKAWTRRSLARLKGCMESHV